MDPELERRIQAARAQGYSDEEIQAALGRTNAAATVPSRVESTAEVPVLSSEERLRLKQEEAQEQMRQQEVAGPSENTTMAAGAAMGRRARRARRPARPRGGGGWTGGAEAGELARVGRVSAARDLSTLPPSFLLESGSAPPFCTRPGVTPRPARAPGRPRPVAAS